MLSGRSLFLAFMATLVAASFGCGGAEQPATTAASSSDPAVESDEIPVEEAVRVVEANTLPIGDAMPPLDEGRVELSKPTDWEVPSRDKRYVVRFRRTSINNFPRIHVTSEPDDWTGVDTLSEDNVLGFAETLAKRLETDEKIRLIEPVIAMMIGDRPAARYVRRTKMKTGDKTVTVERQILVTVGAGRVYTIDLLVPQGRIRAYRDAGYAVCASMKFGSAPETPPAEETTQPPSDKDEAEQDTTDPS